MREGVARAWAAMGPCLPFVAGDRRLGSTDASGQLGLCKSGFTPCSLDELSRLHVHVSYPLISSIGIFVFHPWRPARSGSRRTRRLQHARRHQQHARRHPAPVAPRTPRPIRPSEPGRAWIWAQKTSKPADLSVFRLRRGEACHRQTPKSNPSLSQIRASTRTKNPSSSISRATPSART